MFLARFIAVFTVLVTLVTGAHLRADENELQILSPDHDAELINAAVRRHVHGFKSMPATDKSMIDAHVHVASLAHIKEIKKLESTGSHYVGASSMKDLVEDGYVITRHRANADCSGVVRSLSGYRIGNGNGCTSYSSTLSYKSACFRNKKQDELQMQTMYYTSADCSGDPYYIYDGDDLPKCAINYEDFNSTGFEMIGGQCTGETDISKDLKPGIVAATYQYSCSGSMISFYNMRLGACFPIVAHADHEGDAIGPNTKYFYGTWDECYSNGKVTMSLYTDSVCTRIFAKTTTRIFDEPLDQCTKASSDTEVYSKYWCIPKN